MAVVASQLDAAVSVRDIAESVTRGDGPAHRAEAVLAALFALVMPSAAAVSEWDPVLRRHRTVASDGFRDDALALMDAHFHEDPRFPMVRGQGRTLRTSQIGPDERYGTMFDEVIHPAGFTDGVSVGLAVGGRYVGALHASKASGRVDDETTALLRLLSADLTCLVDPLDGVLVDVSTEESGAFAWSQSDGRAVALTPSCRPSLVSSESPLAALLDPTSWPSRVGRHMLVVAHGELLAVEARPAGRWVVVEHRIPTSPAGLSLRELEVLAELATGATNRMVARSLAVGERTVATHVEHVLAKLGVGNRAGAVAFAVSVGLVRVRGSLTGPPGAEDGPSS